MPDAPLDSRRLLGGELRRLRLTAGLSGPALAKPLGVGQATVSRLETGQVRPTMETIERWLDITKAPVEVRARVMELAGEALVDITGWRFAFRGGMAPQQRQMHRFDEAASHIRHVAPFMIPGHFQPAEYARAVLLGYRLEERLSDIDQAVTARLERARLMRHRTSTPYHVVATEAGLRTVPAGATLESRSAGWRAMLEAAALSHVAIQIIPTDAEMQQVPVCGWMTYDMPAAVDPVIVQVETPAALLTFSGTDVPAFELAWERTLASALDPEQSASLLRRLLGEE